MGELENSILEITLAGMLYTFLQKYTIKNLAKLLWFGFQKGVSRTMLINYNPTTNNQKAY